ncbi:MarR family winged helix-turn-helix transcriptional regulator [Arthrobacter sp. NyZ413]|uniref:MarR family winged helix-turn-helix transcriptional regulator n=1 Tax=Arthrobacter sp. NyZ413 TaxID=3144669 RepID=UPI003BF8FCF4
MRVGRLAEIEGISKPTATRLTGRLEDMGLVERTHDDSDARSCRIRLRPEGQRLLTDASRGADRYLTTRMSALDPADRRVLMRALPVLVRLLETRA